jgi:8-oxo-dGTP pyrophosphatase MutT (NUDIX family)/GNAT superfamily N-acetyltransferase
MNEAGETNETSGGADVPVFGHPPEGSPAAVRPSAYGLVADDAGRLAVVRTPQGLYLPGGGLEGGESPVDAVVREVREECGLQVAVGSWRRRAVDFVYSSTDRTHFEKHSTFVDADVRGPRVAALEPDHELEWMAPGQAIADLSHPSHRWAAAEWQRRVPTEERDAAPDGYAISSDPARLDLRAVHAYLTRSYWAAGIPFDLVERAAANSLCFGVYLGDDQVGFARMITDRATFAYLADVYVLEAHRGKGLGRRLVEQVLAHPDIRNLRRLMLVTRDAAGLYAAHGFEAPVEPSGIMQIRRQNVYAPREPAPSTDPPDAARATG